MDQTQLKKYKKYAMSRLEKEFKNACRFGDMELVKFFLFSPELSKNVDPFVDNCAGLRWACGNNQLEVVKFFLEGKELSKHATININSDEPFRKAAENGSLEVVKYLMSKNKFKEKINVREWSDYALRKSLANGYLDMAKYLLFSPDLVENCDINSVSVMELMYGGTHELRETKPHKSTYNEILEFIFKDKNLSYVMPLEDRDTLFENSFYVETVRYIMLDLEIELEPNPKKTVDYRVKQVLADVQRKKEIIQQKDKLNEELQIKEENKVTIKI